MNNSSFNNENNTPNPSVNPAAQGINNASKKGSDSGEFVKYRITPAGVPITPRPVNVYDGIDRVFAIISVLLGFFFMKLINPAAHPLGSFIFTLTVLVWIAAYGVLRHVKWSLRDILLPMYIGVLSLTYIFTEPNAGWFFTCSLIIGLICYWAMCLMGFSDEKYPTGLAFFEMFRAVFILPFSKYGSMFGAIFSSKKQKKSGGKGANTVLYVILGLALAFVPVVIVISLLGYDDSFSNMMRGILDIVSIDNLGEHIFSFIFGIPVMMYLFGMLYASHVKQYKPGITRRNLDTELAKLKIAPVSLSVGALTPLLLIYVVFFASQFKYYVSAFTHVLPEGLTYSEYAVSGFFQLVIVSIINIVVIFIAGIFMKRASRADRIVARIFSSLYAVFTLVLIATALSKMYLYVDTYGLTEKRIWSSWFMILLAVIFILVLAKQIFTRMKLSSAVITAVCVMYAAISIVNVPAVAVNYNVDKYISGDIDDVSVGMYEYSDIPAGVKLYNAVSEGKCEYDPAKLEHLTWKIEHLKSGDSSRELVDLDLDFFEWNLPYQQALNVLK